MSADDDVVQMLMLLLLPLPPPPPLLLAGDVLLLQRAVRRRTIACMHSCMPHAAWQPSVPPNHTTLPAGWWSRWALTTMKTALLAAPSGTPSSTCGEHSAAPLAQCVGWSG